MRSRFLMLPLMLSCNNDVAVLSLTTAPSVTISNPADGAEIAEQETITFQGKIVDEGSLEDVQATWTDSVAGVLEEDAFIDVDGTVQFITSTLEEGPHTIQLRAIDSSGAAGDATIDITIVDVPDKPSIEVRHPDLNGVEKGLEDTSFIFQVQVSDYQDPPEDLVVELVANPYGLVCTMSPAGDGVAECPAILPVGTYNLAFTVFDTDENSTIGNAPFSVVARADYDEDGDGYTPSGGDCNDANVTVFPGADEICDGLDNDCIEATAIDVGTECYDDDGDGYCESPPCVNTTQTLADCDDTNASRYPDPSVPETVNGLDDDCDGIVDEGTNVYDDDGDGFCESPPCLNAAGTDSDCDDGDFEIYPTADEVCSDGIDNNCNGQYNEQDAIGCEDYYYDEDGDTYGISGTPQCWCDEGEAPYTGLDTRDCYDKNAEANPDATDSWRIHRGDGSFDYDCDGSETKYYTARSAGCSWDFEPFSCELDSEGWDGSVPDCGRSGDYIDDCDEEYDAFCFFLCAFTDPALCTSCWACDEDVTSLDQYCR
ncbi:MAG: putative metal-binding motif-containing protein [Myxococcota bacterium]